MDKRSRLLALQMAAHRTSAKKNSKGLCRICKGHTSSPDYPFCLRHFRDLPPNLRGKNMVAAAEEYLRTPRPLQFIKIKGSALRGSGGNPHYITSLGQYQLYRSENCWILRDGLGHHEIGRYSTIAEAQEAVSNLNRDRTLHNPFAVKSLIR